LRLSPSSARHATTVLSPRSTIFSAGQRILDDGAPFRGIGTRQMQGPPLDSMLGDAAAIFAMRHGGLQCGSCKRSARRAPCSFLGNADARRGTGIVLPRAASAASTSGASETRPDNATSTTEENFRAFMERRDRTGRRVLSASLNDREVASTE
jgi:hypothetical protein